MAHFYPGRPQLTAASAAPECRVSRPLLNGDLIAYIAKTGDQITTFLPPDEPKRSSCIKALIAGLRLAARGRKLIYLASVNGKPRAEESFHAALLSQGFQHGHRGYSCRSIEATQSHA